VRYLSAGSPESNANIVAAFRKGLSESGYVEGRNYEFHAFGRGAIVGADDNSPGLTGARTP
jgi:hypothetical protein